MELLAVIFLFAGLVWAGVLLLHRPPVPGGWVPLITLGSFFASIVIGYEFFHKDIGPLPVTLDRLILGAGCGLFLLDLIVNRRQLPRLEPLDYFVLGWFGILTFSTLTTDFGFANKLPLSRLLFNNLLPVLAYALLRVYPLSSAQRNGFLWLLVGLGLYLGATGVAEWRRWHGLVFPRYITSPAFPEFLGRGRGPLLNPIINGMLMSLCGTACLVLLPLTRRRYWLPLLAICGVTSLGVLSTLTRSCWMGFAASCFLVFLAPMTWRQRAITTFTGICVAAFIFAAFSSQLNRFKRDEHVSVSEMSQSAELRPLLAVVAWEMFQDRPLQGVGFGQYTKYKKPYHQLDKYGLPLQMVLPYMQHNVMLSYLTEIGLIGLLAAAAMWLAIGWRALKPWLSRNPSIESRCYSLLVLTSLVNYLLNGLFHDVSIMPVANATLLLPAALLTHLVPSSSPAVAPEPSLTQQPPAIAPSHGVL